MTGPPKIGDAKGYAPVFGAQDRSHEGEVIQLMPVVHVREEESFENALRRFKRKVEKSGILTELRKRQHFEKPSVKRKRKAVQARKKMLRKLSEERRQGLA